MVHLTKRQGNLVRHHGGCHCGAVRFEALASPRLTVFECNCSICVKKQIKYFLVPFNQFKLVKGHNSLQTYSFNTHQAKYNFCITCGVQPFHIPSSNPEAYGIAMHCLDEGTLKKVTYEKIDSKKEAQPKRKISSSDNKTGVVTLGVKPLDGKGQDLPLRKTSFIAMINSWSQGHSTNTSEKKNHVESTQDSTTTTTDAKTKQDSPTTYTKRTQSTQDSTTTDTNRTQDSTSSTPVSGSPESNRVRLTVDSGVNRTQSTQDSTSSTPVSGSPESNRVRLTADSGVTSTKVEGKSPQQSGHRRFIVTKVVERSPRTSPCL